MWPRNKSYWERKTQYLHTEWKTILPSPSLLPWKRLIFCSLDLSISKTGVVVSTGPLRKVIAEELMLLNCVVGENSWECLGLRSNQFILKEISSGCSLEGLMLMLELKLQYFGHLMGRTDWLEKTLMLAKIEGRRRRRQQRMRWLDDITNAMDMSSGSSGSWWWTGKPGMLQPMRSQKVGHDWATKLSWDRCVEVSKYDTELLCFFEVLSTFAKWSLWLCC